MSARARVCALACLCIVALPAAAFYSLRPPIIYTTGGQPDSVAIGDVTGDGRPDVVMATGSDHSPLDFHLLVFTQGRTGSLAAPRKFPLLGVGWGSSSSGSLRIQLGDLNRDGVKDVVVGHDDGLTVFTALPGGSFSSRLIALAGVVAGLGAADLDQDGDIDLVRQSYDEGKLAILLNKGNGEFAPARAIDAPSGWRPGLRIGDVTGDRRPDVVIINSRSLVVYPGRGDGSLLPARVIPYPDPESARGFSSVMIADVDRDGRNDIVAATTGNVPHAKLWIFKQTATGILAPATTLPTGERPDALMAADLDNNGYTDLVYMTEVAYAGNAVSYLLQDRTGLSYEHWFGGVPAATWIWSDGLALGDINGDGCTDAVFANGLGMMAFMHGYKCIEPAAVISRHEGDFDGDRKSDILWHNEATGANVIWRSGNSSQQVQLTRVTDTNWKIAGVGDFDGDGRSDILWRHAVKGYNGVWSGGEYAQRKSLTTISDSHWQVAGIGDFDRNGRDDLLWRERYSGRNAIWPDAMYASSRSIAPLTDADWGVAGVGDFDGDGGADVLWRHAGDGRNQIWRRGDSTMGQTLTAVTAKAWQVAAVADFDGDRRTDILWRNAFDGRNVVWSAARSGAQRSLSRVADLSWKVVATGDYAGDGRSDVLWRNSRTGANDLWPDASSRGMKRLTTVPNLNWKVTR